MNAASLTTGKPNRNVAATVLAVASLIWIGALFGVSFLATPVKFLAPSLSLPVALDVGRQTFFWFGRVEVAFALVGLAAAVAVQRQRSGHHHGFRLGTALALLLLASVLLQRAWLLPYLDTRVELIIQGTTPPASRWHEVYIAMELVKLGLLCVLAAAAIGSLSRAAPSGTTD